MYCWVAEVISRPPDPQIKNLKGGENVMTGKKERSVTDEVLGKIAKRQWEIFRRVKEGTLDPESVLELLQCIIEEREAIFILERTNC